MWSPDGCKLLGQLPDQRWAILTLSDMNIHQFPQAVELVSPIWGLDSQSVTYSSYPQNGMRPVTIYSVDLENNTIEALFSFSRRGIALQWLSDTALLYSVEGELRVWDMTTKQSQPFETDQYPGYGRPEGMHGIGTHSADRTMLADFFDIIAHNLTLSEQNPALLLPEERATVEAYPKVPGFDLYFLNQGTRRHVDVNGQFVQSLEWSPSGQQIALMTVPDVTQDDLDGIYVYHIQEDWLQKVDDFPALYDPEFGEYVATWSPDEEWLAFQTPTGPVIYHLIENQVIALDDRLNAHRLEWSPVMNYSETHCT